MRGSQSGMTELLARLLREALGAHAHDVESVSGDSVKPRDLLTSAAHAAALLRQHRVRNDERHKNVPIIVISTENSVEDRQRAMTLGATAYVQKPIQAPQVIAKVKEVLKISE